MRCHSCLAQSTKIYCSKCTKEFFGGRKISSLSFDKRVFYQKRKEYTKRISISSVQDKLFLTFDENNTLMTTDIEGHYILKPSPSEDQVDNNHDICANEHLSMQISKQIFKIPTAESALIPFSTGELAYITAHAGLIRTLCRLVFGQFLLKTAECPNIKRLEFCQ